ncbi:MAG: hypothetical protein AAGA93_19980 [Actinomycetota bacterium]
MDDLVDVDEWNRWRVSRRGRETFGRWTERHPVLIDDQPGDDTGCVAPGEVRWSPMVDRRQAALVALAQEGDDRAAIALLIQLRPGLRRLVRLEQRRWGIRWGEAADEVRSAFFETLCVHPLDRRPDRIAANLVLDTRQRLRRSAAGSRRPRPTPQPIATDAVARQSAGHTDLVHTVGRAVRGLPGTTSSQAITAKAAYRAWVLDRPAGEIAGELGLDRAAVRQRLHRLRVAVRRQWPDRVEAA